MSRELTRTERIERSIIKKYRKELWRPFILAVKRYELVQEGDHIAVCISGGKDSMLLAKLMQELQRHSKAKFALTFLVMDPGYNAENRRKIEENAATLGIPVTIFESDVFDAAASAYRNPCYLCARMRRGCLYGKARELGCNKIALGHHFNDVIETTMLGLFYGAQLQGMLPKLHAKNFPGMELIRPLYCVHEENIIAWARYNELTFIQCACKLTKAIAAGDDAVASKRQEIKLLLRELRKDNPDIEKSIFRAIHKCSLDTMVGFKYRGEEHSFLDFYDSAFSLEDEPHLAAGADAQTEDSGHAADSLVGG